MYPAERDGASADDNRPSGASRLPNGSPRDHLSETHASKRDASPFRFPNVTFNNLVALANDQEEWGEANKSVKRRMWREVGQPPLPLHTLRRCLGHASRGAVRAAILAGAVRSALNIFLVLFRAILAPRKFRLIALLRALFGRNTLRFSAMMASYTFIYKFLLNSLPLLSKMDRSGVLRECRVIAGLEEKCDSPASPRAGRYDIPSVVPTSNAAKPGQLSAQGKKSYSRLEVERRHAIIAGTIAGFSVLWESRANRTTIAQQVFVRGLQGTWNAWSPRYGLKVPYGSSLVFGLCCGQIMYCFLLRPDALPKAYWNWILKASKVFPESLYVNRQVFDNGTFEIRHMETLMKKSNTTPYNYGVMKEMAERARMGDFVGNKVRCESIHPWIDSCITAEVDRFVKVFSWAFAMYGALHTIPMIIFRNKLIAKDPRGALLRALAGTARSSTFLAVFVGIFQSILCMEVQTQNSVWASRFPLIQKYALSRPTAWFIGTMCGFALLVEKQRRRAELVMYVLPRGLDSAWSLLRSAGWLPRIPFGDSILCAVGMGMVMSTYQCDPQHLSSLVRRILYEFIGPN